MKAFTALAAPTATLPAATPVFAQSKGDMTPGLGVHSISPTSSNSATTAGLANVDSNIRPTLTFEYFVADNLGIEVLASSL